MSEITIKEIVQFTEMTKATVLAAGDKETLASVGKVVHKWVSNGADKLPEVTAEEVMSLMESIVFSQVAILSRQPPVEVGMVLTDVNYATLKFIKTHIVQQAIRLGRAHAKIDRLESVIARLKEDQAR